jgi:hypothetical protein
VTVPERAKTWVEIVLPTGERFDLELPDGEEPLIPPAYPVERGPDGQHALVCLDVVRHMYALARRDLPGAEPEQTEAAPVEPDLGDAMPAAVYFGEITSLSALIDERFELLPSKMRPRFEAALASARAGIEQLPRPDQQDGWGHLHREQVVLLRETRDVMHTVAESIVHGILQPDVPEDLFREAAQLLDVAIHRRTEDVRSRVRLLDQPHRDTATADLDRIQHVRAQSFQDLRGEAAAARGAGDLSQHDKRRIEHRAYRCTLEAYEQMGELLDNLGPEGTPSAEPDGRQAA